MRNPVTAFLRNHFLAALIAGVLLGIAARAVMRCIALISGSPRGFSTGGSVEVVIFGALLGTPLALVFFAFRARLRMAAPWPGVIYGSLAFVALALIPPPAAASALAGTPDPLAITAMLFWLLFALFGSGIDWRWTRWSTRHRGG